MRKSFFFVLMVVFLAVTAYADEIRIGEKLPLIDIEQKGQMIPEYDIKDGKMVFRTGTDISYKNWSSSELTGRIGVVYHLAARSGTEDINKDFIDALIAADLPEYLPNSPYKTTTILNTADAIWGTSGIATGRFEASQKDTAYACYTTDKSGIAQKSWGLKAKGSAIIILDKEGKVLYFKDGKMTQYEIEMAILLIQKKLGISM